jgi:transcriptional antiterminator RfaH
MDLSHNPRWIVVQSKPNREMWARQNIINQGMECYLPLIRDVAATRPLFPRYLFARISTRWFFLNNTFGVSNVVLLGDQPAVVPDDVIAEIKGREVQGLVVLPNASGTLIHGQAVVVNAGPFTGMSGVYQGMASGDRERVLLDYLGRKTTILIARNALE